MCSAPAGSIFHLARKIVPSGSRVLHVTDSAMHVYCGAIKVPCKSTPLYLHTNL